MSVGDKSNKSFTLPCKWKKAAGANSSGSRVPGMTTSAARWNRCWRITVNPRALSRRRHLLTRARPHCDHVALGLDHLDPTLNPKSGLADTVIGHYRVLGKIGCGGMGVVYEAEDLKLGRHVALKFLPEELAEDPESLQRFRREARSASALNHPNICTVYEVDEANGRAFIAMELVEGKTLRELLVSGSLPMRKAIEIAAQVAEGLTKAHEAGIAHRDLKPENLMVSHDGFVKILDFGLAKLASPSENVGYVARHVADAPGLVLGTVGYMSPEQASGQQLDFRSDQFSFGLVLYEMVTGKRAFQRSTAAETLVAILREQAEPIGTQNRDAPAPLCWAIERCLAKEPDKRYVSTRDLARELAAIRDRFSEKPVQAGGDAPGESSCAANRVCGAGEGSSCRQRTAAASGCAPGHGHGSRRDRQNASRGGGGEWPWSSAFQVAFILFRSPR